MSADALANESLIAVQSVNQKSYGRHVGTYTPPARNTTYYVGTVDTHLFTLPNCFNGIESFVNYSSEKHVGQH